MASNIRRRCRDWITRFRRGDVPLIYDENWLPNPIEPCPGDGTARAGTPRQEPMSRL